MKKTANALRVAALAGLIAVAGLGVARADEVSDGLAKAGELYAKGDLAGAMKEIGFASSGIQSKLNDAYASTLPEPPAGWTAEAVDAQSMAIMGMGQNISRTYTDANGNSVKLSLAADSPLLQSMGMVFANPMMAAQAGFTRVRVGSEEALMQDDKQANSVQIMLTLGGRLLLMAEASNVPADQVKALFSAWKIDQLKKLAGI
ncbi:hypothetical protein [Zavarzinia sp.]|uniref:hypothetical protein n=1 Tax=Zavarzinia sp. TaxID=2027920 RepID=UPI003563ED2E